MKECCELAKRQTAEDIKKLICTCIDVSKETESAYKRVQLGFNESCLHHKIDDFLNQGQNHTKEKEKSKGCYKHYLNVDRTCGHYYSWEENSPVDTIWLCKKCRGVS